ncbi:DUF1778 domain-containing protein [Vibrio owensii]|uniref:type II toxin -antitoxin system TacA 1-like antitoxin n=1 Tax=Vibrio harveyi group TaxID=717610 RepID=UPI003CC57888
MSNEKTNDLLSENDREVTKLGASAWNKLNHLLQNPTKPTPELKRLMRGRSLDYGNTI